MLVEPSDDIKGFLQEKLNEEIRHLQDTLVHLDKNWTRDNADKSPYIKYQAVQKLNQDIQKHKEMLYEVSTW